MKTLDTEYWWTMFINQMARVAVDNNIDARTDEGFEECKELFILISKSN